MKQYFSKDTEIWRYIQGFSIFFLKELIKYVAATTSSIDSGTTEFSSQKC